jgi:hypothetical protein
MTETVPESMFGTQRRAPATVLASGFWPTATFAVTFIVAGSTR